MTTIHAQLVGDKALLLRSEFEQLLGLARQSEVVDLQVQPHDLPTPDVMTLAEQGGAFDFWREAGEDIYTTHDGEPVFETSG
ncbi:MAG TPA: hypothetical protein VG013_29115 [Gemmataceae bacterium]|jgi:hypothetical protein|nr:hypothetical protein [Gemmataceae bacterium]